MIRYSFFGYALASAIILIICGWSYQFFFSSKIRPSVNRAVLLSILFLGMTMPLMGLLFFPVSRGNVEHIVIGSPMVANVLVERPAENSLSSLVVSFLPYLNYIYFAGIIVLSVSALVSIIRLMIIKKSAQKIVLHGITVYKHNNKFLSSFSWMNWIFIYDGAVKDDTYALITHELAHVRLYHWVDIILTQLILILQWFNPAVWILKKELDEVHEFQADNKVINSGTDKFDYQLMLLRNLSNGRVPVLVAGIKGRSIKKRLQMMHKTDFKSNYFVRGISVCVAVLCGMILLKMPAVAEVVEVQQPVPKENIVVLGNEDLDDIVYYIDNKQVTSEDVSNYDSSRISCIEVFNDDNKAIGIVSKEYNEENKINIKKKSSKLSLLPIENYIKDSGVKLDRMPCYEGGEMRLKEELKNFIYYRSSRKISGTVEISFIVNSEGSLEKFRILRSLDTQLDILAMQALRSLSGKWSPGIKDGKVVEVEMKLPIDFSS